MRVSNVSTGAQVVRPQVAAGSRWPRPLWLLTSRRWASAPVNVFVVEHPRGLVLFDTGQNLASVADPGYFPGGVAGGLYRRLGHPTMGPADTLSAGLSRLGYDVGDVRAVVLSHLHHDHIGGLGELGRADIVVSAREREDLAGRSTQFRGLQREHIELPGLRWRPIVPDRPVDRMLTPFTAGYDLFDDGSLVLLPTPGHTPGSLSMLVDRADGPSLLLVGDLVFSAEQIALGGVPGVSDKRATRTTVQRVRELRRGLPRGLTVLAAHDPSAGDLLARSGVSSRYAG
jgi:N-acyl homoserine lactone hydrolase